MRPLTYATLLTFATIAVATPASAQDALGASAQNATSATMQDNSSATAQSASSTMMTDSPSATASFTGATVAIGLGFTWGKGVLTFEGKTYPFKVDGLSAIGAGVTKMSGVGTIYHLKSAADFAGTYASAGGGASLGSHGQGSASLKNDKGVVIEFHAKEKGVSINLDLSGVHIKMVPA
jgi:hypothetical protein